MSETRGPEHDSDVGGRMTPAKINRAVAKEVMGWSEFDPSVHNGRAGKSSEFWVDETGRLFRGAGLGPFGPYHSISDAWKVVGRLHELDLTLSLLEVSADRTLALITSPDFLRYADSAPEAPAAICLAALKAKRA